MEDKFFNRELSWIEFNARVLGKALDKSVPLMERVQFLSIVSSNFDEFFQVRVASIKREAALVESSSRAADGTTEAAGKAAASGAAVTASSYAAEAYQAADISGYTPDELLKKISDRCHEVLHTQHECLMEDIVPSLAANGLVYVPPASYTSEQEEFTRDVFRSEIFPLLTPLRAEGKDNSDMMFIRNLTLHAAFLLKPIEGIKASADMSGLGGQASAVADGTAYAPFACDLAGGDKDLRIALVPIPARLSKVVWLPNENGKRDDTTADGKQFALLDDIIGMFGTMLFPGFEVVELLFFRIARDADFAVDEDAGDNFVHAMENVLEARKSSRPVFLECSGGGGVMLPVLLQRLELSYDDVYCVDGILEPSSLLELRSVSPARMSYPQWQHFWPASLPSDDTFWQTLSRHDVLLNVPYMSYDPVVKILTDAAEDKDVVAIKMTLYRTGSSSPIVAALEKAASNGKQVVVLVELKARFDEERNIAWAEELEKSGVIVIYGLVNLKVHAKALMIMRREGDEIRRYVHLSTGNYNPKTAKLYSDISLFTANEDIATDLTLFFNLVTGYSTLQTMKHLSLAPVTMKSRIISMIDHEASLSMAGGSGLIMAKMNSLTHEEVIEALYRASRAGVRIMLNVRGICMLVPGVKGMSENITVTSIVDRYLEHARIFYFQNGGSDELYCASADWMPRNLDRRIELMFPILDGNVFKEMKKVLDTYFEDNGSSCTLLSDGTWQSNKAEDAKERRSAQDMLYHRYKKMYAKREKGEGTDFTVRRK